MGRKLFMPTTKLSNMVYRARIAIPWHIPGLERHPQMSVDGSPLFSERKYLHILRKHHVLGSAAMLDDSTRNVTILTSSGNPKHEITAQSVFRVASITKMASALAALVAVEAGKLSLKAPISSYLSEFGKIPGLDRISLFHLLSHTSGIEDPVGLEEALLREESIVNILPASIRYDPGQRFQYSNLGFGIVGCLLESVFHQSVEEVFQQIIFKPLHMKATLSASTLNEEQIVPITRIYPWHKNGDLRVTPLGKKPILDPAPFFHYGYTAGAMYVDLSSLRELLLCLMQNGSPLLHSDLGSMFSQQHAQYGKISPQLSYGLGLLRIDDPTISSSLILGHQGFAYGCADGAFWEKDTGRMVLFLNGGASEARRGRLGLCNYDILRWALREEMPQWQK